MLQLLIKAQVRTSWQQRPAEQLAAQREAERELFDAWHPAADEQIAALNRQVVRTEVRDMGRTPAEVEAHRVQAIREATNGRHTPQADTEGVALL
ncbi:MAG: hypothetical protein U1E77_19410 [Inhella sp.]